MIQIKAKHRRLAEENAEAEVNKDTSNSSSSGGAPEWAMDETNTADTSQAGQTSQKDSIGTTTTTANVSIGQNDEGGFKLAVDLHTNIPGVSIEEAQNLIEKAHSICPYSNATRGNIEVNLTVSND